MTPELNIARLTALASRLRLGVAGFELGAWHSCAIGVATNMPEFKLAGLGWNGVFPTFNMRIGYDAAAAFFGIPYRTAREIFCPDSYPFSARFTGPKSSGQTD